MRWSIAVWLLVAASGCGQAVVEFPLPACSDGECGGACTPCAVGARCAAASDCASGRCEGGRCASASASLAAACSAPDGGGGGDLGCAGGGCRSDEECASHICDVATGACAAPTCTDGVRNGAEAGVDCGGVCPAC